ncbi:hypothetical protein BGW39_003795, partial [Mortierella sp. 14UC]
PTISPGLKDPGFIALAKDVERIYRSIFDKKQGPLCAPQDIDSDVKALVGERVEVEFLARMLFLQLLLNNNPDLEPQQFFREQITRGASTIRELVKGLRMYGSITIQDMLDIVQIKLHTHLDLRRRGLAIALDEAQVAATSILAGKLISPSALAAYWNTRNSPSVLFDDKNEIHRHLRRGFPTPLSATLSNMQATLVILGTALSLQDADHVYSAIAKPTNFSRITEFPRFDENDDQQDALGAGRYDSKQAILVDAVDKSIEHTMNGLRAGQSDFVDKALCRLRPHPDGIHLMMDEPIVVEAVHAELKASGKDPAFLEYPVQLYQIITNFGVASTSKGMHWNHLPIDHFSASMVSISWIFLSFKALPCPNGATVSSFKLTRSTQPM